MTSRYGTDRAAVVGLLAEWGEPAYRAGQLWDGLYLRRLPLEDCTDLPAALRARLGRGTPARTRPPGRAAIP